MAEVEWSLYGHGVIEHLMTVLIGPTTKHVVAHGLAYLRMQTSLFRKLKCRFDNENALLLQRK